jgi:hypothetical protein
MAEEFETQASPSDTPELVVATGEPLGIDDHNADTETASPWPVRTSPYV